MERATVKTNWIGGLPLAYRNTKIAKSLRDEIITQLQITPRISLDTLRLNLRMNVKRVRKELLELVKENLVDTAIGYRNSPIYWSVK